MMVTGEFGSEEPGGGSGAEADHKDIQINADVLRFRESRAQERTGIGREEFSMRFQEGEEGLRLDLRGQ